MSGFLSKFKSEPITSVTTWRDETNPHIVYRISDKARRVSLKVRAADRHVEVVVPGRRALADAQAFVHAQADWIDVQLEGLPPPMPFRPGGQILVRGELYGLGNPAGRGGERGGGRGRPRLDHVRKRVIVPAPASEFANRTRRLLIREAREALEAATHHYADMIDRRVGKISVRDTASRWGSSATRRGPGGAEGHISYSWRLVCAPDWVLDYVCAHEVAHLVEPNHSPAFWAVVDQLYDETKAAKRWLKRNGAALHAVGAEI